MSDEIPSDISKLLEKAFDEKIDNLEIENRGGNAAGQGYLGEIMYLTVRNKNTDKKWHLVVKQVLKSTEQDTVEFLSRNYSNEINFYTKVIPSYVEFQKSYPNCKTFDGVAKCYATSMEKGNEKLVFDNLTAANYQVHSKNEPITDAMYEEIFKFYGNFHGVSMAFKIHQSEKFAELAGLFNNNYKTLAKGFVGNAIIYTCRGLKKHLDEIGESKLSEKFEKYVRNGVQLLIDSLSYQSRSAAILHGDCWSNNLMFKFNEFKKVEDMKIIDLQMVISGSPVLDLSYSFYSGAAKETLDKLDHFLHVYHNTLRETLKQYDCDIDKIFSFDDLKKAWKENNAFGFLMGLLVWITKYGNVTEASTLSEMIDQDKNTNKTIEEEENILKKQIGDYNSKKFLQMGMDLIRHMYENDFL